MTEVALAESAGVNVDVCRHCQFVWFDPHEVESLQPKPPPKRIRPAPEKAREILALEKVTQLASDDEDTDFIDWWRQIARIFGGPWL
jgi:Zn-finger nucleic acid-binding protein